jgi:hypothetical protein
MRRDVFSRIEYADTGRGVSFFLSFIVGRDQCGGGGSRIGWCLKGEGEGSGSGSWRSDKASRKSGGRKDHGLGREEEPAFRHHTHVLDEANNKK